MTYHAEYTNLVWSVYILLTILGRRISGFGTPVLLVYKYIDRDQKKPVSTIFIRGACRLLFIYLHLFLFFLSFLSFVYLFVCLFLHYCFFSCLVLSCLQIKLMARLTNQNGHRRKIMIQNWKVRSNMTQLYPQLKPQ